jgi:LysR family glycine cleavage system transcriptional activator
MRMTRRLPNLNQLRTFEAAARHGSFKKAAEELSVSQAAISHQIKALEEYYGCRIFNRLNRKVVLTDAASVLAKDLTEAFDRIAGASKELRSSEMRGEVRISVTPFYANRMILPYLDDFLSEYPGLKIEFDYSYRIADFESSNIEGALRYGLSDRSDAQMRLIHYDRVAPVTSPALVQGVVLPLAAEKVAKLPRRGIIWSKHKQRALALDYALAGNGVALADLPLIRNELETGSLVCLSETEIILDRGIHLAEPPGPYKDARLAAFGDWLSERIERMGPGT